MEDTTKKVHILNNTKNLEFRTVDDSTKLTIVTGDVKLRQGTALFYCDSCVINNRTNIFEAWGKVHINDSDTANVVIQNEQNFRDQVRNRRKLQAAAQIVDLQNRTARSTINGVQVVAVVVDGNFRL